MKKSILVSGIMAVTSLTALVAIIVTERVRKGRKIYKRMEDLGYFDTSDGDTKAMVNTVDMSKLKLNYKGSEDDIVEAIKSRAVNEGASYSAPETNPFNSDLTDAFATDSQHPFNIA